MFRLKTLYIKEYKNIKNQLFDFSTNTGYIALIGLNGSGKSNLLEAISLIFDELYGIPTAERVNGFIIAFQIDGGDYLYRTVDYTEEHNIIPLNNRGRNPRLPSSVIACYSGEDLRLWHMAYENYYMQYFKKAVRNRLFSPKIMYINKYCWKIAFIALLCSQKENVRLFFKEKFHYNDISDISVKFTIDIQKKRIFTHHNACRWYDALMHNADQQGVINANFIASTDMTMYGAPSQFAPDYVFQFLYLLSLPKKDRQKRQTIDKLITDIKIIVNNVGFDDLSEGEKKMILVECINQVLGNDDSLVLLDEPDAHVHVEYKKKLLEETIIPFTGQTVFTTHSPVMCNLIPDPQNLYLLNDGVREDTSKLEQFKRLSGGEIQYFEGALILSSNNPLVLVEGIGDINYIKKAIDLLSNSHEDYKNISWNFLFMGGAGKNAKQYIDKISPHINEQRKVIVVFDRDESGAEAMKDLGFSGNRNDFKTYKKGNWYYTMLPKTADHTETDFTIEDYFSIDYKKKIAKKKIDDSGGFFKKLPKDLRQNVKDDLGNHLINYTAADMDGFSVLIDKMLNILNGKETDIEEKSI